MSGSHIHEPPLVPDSLLDSVSLFSKKWHSTISRCLSADNAQGLLDRERRRGGVSSRVLTDVLAEPQKDELTGRRNVRQRPLRVNYLLTERCEELEPVDEAFDAETLKRVPIGGPQ